MSSNMTDHFEQKVQIKPTSGTRIFRVKRIPETWTEAHLQEALTALLQTDDFHITSLGSTCFPSRPNYPNVQTALLTIEGCPLLPDELLNLYENKITNTTLKHCSNQLLFDNCLGLTSLYSPSEPQADIIFVHGLSGHAIASWSTSNGICWPRDFLGRDFSECRILTFGYDAKLAKDGSNARLTDYGTALRDDILNLRDSNELQKRPLVLIGHSFGGTVITSAIHLMYRDIEGSRHRANIHALHCLVFFGVPLQGTSLESLKKLTEQRSEPSKSRVLDDLKPGSEILSVLRHTIDSLRKRSEPKLGIITCIEQIQKQGQVFVDKDEARFYSAEERIIPIHADHRQMVKFPDHDYGPYVTLIRTLREMLSGALKSAINPSRVLDLSSTMILNDDEFIGRQNDLRRLRDLILGNKQTKRANVIGVVGLGGVGKTQLALQYREKYYRDYDVSFSASASNAVDLQATISALVRELTGECSRSTKENRTRLVEWSRCNTSVRVLIIFDNVDISLYSEYMDSLPWQGPADILLTTRSKEAAQYYAGSAARILELEGWGEHEAMEYLRANIDEAAQGKPEVALAIVRTVKGLPLALEQVARYTQLIGQNLSATLDDLQTDKMKVLNSAKTSQGIIACFETTFLGLEKESPSSLELMSFLVFLDTQSIGQEIMTYANIKTIPAFGKFSSVDLKRANAGLKNLALLKEDTKTGRASIHDLAHEIFLDRLSNAEQTSKLSEVLKFVWRKFPRAEWAHEEGMWANVLAYLPHAVKVIEHCERLHVVDERVFELWIRTAQTLAEKEMDVQARMLARRAYSNIENFEISLSNQVEACTTFGYVLNYAGNYEEAAPYYEHALRIARHELGRWNNQTLTCFHNWAGVCFKRGKVDEAIGYFEEVVQLGRKIYYNADTGEHPFASMISLAEAYRSKQDPKLLDKAESLLRESIAGFNGRLGPMSSWTLFAMAELGKTLLEKPFCDRGQAIAEAVIKLEQAASRLSEVLGPSDQYTRQAQDDLKRARALKKSIDKDTM